MKPSEVANLVARATNASALEVTSMFDKIESLSIHDQLMVCAALSTNRNTPQPILRHLFYVYAPRCAYLWWLLADHPYLPIDLAYQFALCEDVELAQKARRRISMQEALQWLNAIEGLTERSDLLYLSESPAMSVRMKVAGNAHTSADVLEKLAEDVDAVALCLLDNPSTPPEALNRLYQRYGEHLAVAAQIVSHNNCTAELRTKIAKEHKGLMNLVLREVSRQKLLERLLSDLLD